MAIALGFERGILGYHLDRLRAAELADITGFLDNDSRWAITAEGRRYVVERRGSRRHKRDIQANSLMETIVVIGL